MTATALIVKLAAIGDVVMALPMATALRAIDPHVRITWLAGATAAPLLRYVREIDEVVQIDDVALLAGGAARKAMTVRDAWAKLRGRRFDRVFIAHSDARYRWLTRGVRCADTRWLGARATRPNLLPFRQFSDEYVRLVTGVDDFSAPRYGAPAVDTPLDDEVAARIAPIGPRRIIALAPGGARNPARDNPLRRWPLGRYAEVARRLADRGDVVAITGSADDAWIRDAFATIPVLDLVAATTLPGLVALYARCAAVVTHDSGPLHLARLAGTRVVGLFGPTPPAAFVREDSRTVAIWQADGLACAPCYDGREFAACSDNLCMQAITPETTLARLDALLAASAR